MAASGRPARAPPSTGWNATTARLVDLLYTYREDVLAFLRHGKACFVAVCFLSVTFSSARALMPYFCARFLGIEGGTLRQIVEVQTALIFLVVFFAPTPGGRRHRRGGLALDHGRHRAPGHRALLQPALAQPRPIYLAALGGPPVPGLRPWPGTLEGRGPDLGRRA